MQYWKRLGLLFCPENNYDWMLTHAANPVAEQISDDIFRVYFSCRDAQNRAHIGTVDVDFAHDFRLTNIAEIPVLSPGEIGLFDDSGVSMGCILRTPTQKLLYYMGWNLCTTVPWRNSIGLAVWDEKTQAFKKHGKAPIVDRSEADPFSISYPFLLADDGHFKVYYGSNMRGNAADERMDHRIKYAESTDGITWQREGKVAIEIQNEAEYAFSKPCVLKENGVYKMWYSFRGQPGLDAYRIGYAESLDGRNWTRHDEQVRFVGEASEWDCDAQSYPFIMDWRGQRFMFYNGNRYGKTGFGLAVIAND